MRRLFCAILVVFMAFSLTTGAKASFPDIKSGSWYGAAVEEMAEAGYLKGMPDGRFHPHETITAAQFVTIAARCAGLSPSVGQTSSWASGTMQAALEAGWYDWDEIPPTGELFSKPIRRELAVKILMRALLPDKRGDYLTESAKMKDFSKLDGRYYEPVLAAYAAGVVNGDGNGNFKPKDGMTRAEACVVFSRALKVVDAEPSPPGPGVTDPPPSPVETVRGGVSENGWLSVAGTQLVNESGEPVVLRGMSSHGLQWYSNFTSVQSIKNTASFGANVFRLAMYTAEGGYVSDPSGMTKKLYAAADAAIANDMYVIIDWHILSDGNPQTYKKEALKFFAQVSERYKDCPAVIYEVCNEPNGGVSWSRDIKPYEEEVVAVIREHSPRSVILLGSGTWSQDLHEAARSPLKGENLMYTLHFYAGTHGAELRKRIDESLNAGLPVFVSEWGVSRADGNGGVYTDASDIWLDFLAERGISWCNWSLCDKNETSAALRPGTSPVREWTWDDLSESGKYVFSRFNG